jgi:N-acetylglucosaminyl-diphospho-decaprenol L-rhamnosyltransferase
MTKMVSAIIVNYNTFEHTVMCVSTLLQQLDVEVQIIVVDNSSSDDSVDKLKSVFGTKINVIQNDENLGFSKANNIGAKVALGDFIACINPDIKLEHLDSLLRLVKHLESDKEIGMLGPAVIEPRKHRVIKPKTTYPQQSLLRHTHSIGNLPGKYAWLLGAFLLFPAKVYKEIGGFDEDYFLYGEDTDIGLKVRRAGYKIDHISDVEVIHWSGASEASSEAYPKWLRKKKGYYQFCFKNYHQEDFIRILKSRLISCRLKLIGLKLKFIFFKSNALTDSISKVLAEMDVIQSYQQFEFKRN